MDSPSWLTPDGDGAAAPAPAEPMEFESSAPAPAAAAESTSRAAPAVADDPDLPGVILTMRLANMAVSIALIVCSVSFIDGRNRKTSATQCHGHRRTTPAKVYTDDSFDSLMVQAKALL
jgi:hypothetical protein